MIGAAPSADGSPTTLTGQVSHWFGQAAQIVTGVAGFSYAFGWVVTARFFGAFGVDPEDAGITFGWLAIRAFLVGITGLVVFVVSRHLLQAAERSAPVVHIVQSRAAIVVLTVVSCMGVAGLAALCLAVWTTSRGGEVDAVPVTVILLCGAVSTGLVLWLRPPAVQLGWNTSLWLRGIAGALLGFLGVSLLLLPYRLSDHLAADVRAGRSVRLLMAPGVPALQVTRVQLAAVDGQSPPPHLPPPGTCVSRLGGAAGVSLYHVDGTVLRVADESVTARGPCRPAR
ncbi:hypothetical protein AB0K04_20890 [Micromonospora coxensis]|uniref:hypothetical protein n=1 Tax=Micromonospora coxensis TaxID=356852 RepID=UPI0034357B10